MKVNQAQKINQTNQGQGMENFINPSPGSNPQKVEAKPVVQAKAELESEIEEIERKLVKVRKLDLTAFNNVIYSKKLMFRFLFARSRIYVVVRNDEGKTVYLAINPPRYGGTSIRYIMNECLDWCRVVQKDTRKGRILSYESVNSNILDRGDELVDDIFS